MIQESLFEPMAKMSRMAVSDATTGLEVAHMKMKQFAALGSEEEFPLEKNRAVDGSLPLLADTLSTQDVEHRELEKDCLRELRSIEDLLHGTHFGEVCVEGWELMGVRNGDGSLIGQYELLGGWNEEAIPEVVCVSVVIVNVDGPGQFKVKWSEVK